MKTGPRATARTQNSTKSNKMKISLDFSEGSLSIPTAAFRRLKRASNTALRFLMVLVSDASVRENFEGEAERVAKLIGCGREELSAALAFWCGAGVAELEDEREAGAAGADDTDTQSPPGSVDVAAKRSKARQGSGSVPERGAALKTEKDSVSQDVAALEADEPVAKNAAGAGKSADENAVGAGKSADENAAGAGKSAQNAAAGAGKPADETVAGAGKPADENAAEAERPIVRKTKLRRAAEVPDYTTEELNGLLESDLDAVALVDEGQRHIGRMFNPREVAILVGLKNYLGLTNEYIFILLGHCARIGKTSMHYVESTAFGMYDEGIHDADALRAKLAERELYSSFEGRFKTMIGGRGRRLSAKESRFVNRWCLEMKLDFEMIELAYDITVDRCHEYNPAYMNGILERWFADGITTPEAVRADAEAHLKSSGGLPVGAQTGAKNAAKSSRADTRGASFDTDEFFEAALKRSYSDN